MKRTNFRLSLLRLRLVAKPMTHWLRLVAFMAVVRAVALVRRVGRWRWRQLLLQRVKMMRLGWVEEQRPRSMCFTPSSREQAVVREARCSGRRSISRRH